MGIILITAQVADRVCPLPRVSRKEVEGQGSNCLMIFWVLGATKKTKMHTC